MVSVIVLCYNQAEFVTATLDSVAAQTFKDTELILVDDSSTDASVKVIEEWINRRNIVCTLIRHKANMGICRSLNDAITAARGTFISITAADDLWTADKIADQIALMESAPDTVGVVYSDAYQIDRHGLPLPGTLIQSYRPGPPPEGNIHAALWECNFVPPPTTLIRRRCFDAVGLYDEKLYFEDWDMWLRISRQFEFLYMVQPTAYYRVLASSMWRSKQETIQKAIVRMYIKHLRGGALPREERDIILGRLRYLAVDAYKRGYPGASELMILLCKYIRDLRFFMLTAACYAHIPAAVTRVYCRLRYAFSLPLRSARWRGI